jgi:hypothetical protein
MKAHELLSDRSKWTQGVLARNKEGNPCSVFADYAESFCMLGAVKRCYELIDNYDSTTYYSRVEPYFTILGKITVYLRDIKKTAECPSYYNDRHTYEEIITLLKELDI